MSNSKQDQNKELVLEAFDTLFNRRDYKQAERFWSSDYIQHSAHIAPGRDGLFNLVNIIPANLRYEHGLILADDEHVIVHGRFSGFGEVAWITADILRIVDGIFVEHWDVIQDEATQSQSKVADQCLGNAFLQHEVEDEKSSKRSYPSGSYWCRKLGALWPYSGATES